MQIVVKVVSEIYDVPVVAAEIIVLPTYVHNIKMGLD